MAEPIQVVLADDHTIFRAGLKALLELEGGVTVVGEAATGDEAVERGEVYLPARATTLLLQQYRVAGADEGGESQGLRELSSREREVLALTAEGFSSSEIGDRLFISPKTVDTYRSRIMRKLGLTHRSELVRFALKVGLLRDL